MSWRSNSFSDFAGGRPRPNLARSLGSFFKFSQIKDALLRPSVIPGITATLIGLDNLEIATFENQLNPSLEAEVRLYGQHVHFDRVLPNISFQLGSGLDIELIPINGGGSISMLEGTGLQVIGSGHILCRFAGYFRGPGFFVSAQASAGMDTPGTGSYLGAGYQYSGGSLAVGGGVGNIPAGWYRLALLGDPAAPLTLSGVAFVQRKVADLLGTATPEDWQFHAEVFRASGDLGSLVCGGWRVDGSDTLATQNFAEDSADYGLSNEDRQLLLVSYPSGGTNQTVWNHVHVSDSDKELI